MTDQAPDVGDHETLTWRALWTQTAETLGDRNHGRWMCEVASGLDGSAFLAELDQPATQRTVAHLDAMIARRQAGEPLQYVLGRWAFRSLDLLVDQRVLIPRPETEWVCETAIQLARKMLPTESPLQIADLGTGSGAIGLALASELPVDAAQVWLADVCADALDVARANMAGCGRAAVHVRVVQGSWFEALPATLAGTLDLVVANPPYIAADSPDVEASVSDWEPHKALFANADGLSDIIVIVRDAMKWLRFGGWLVIEIGHDQGQRVHATLVEAGYDAVEIRPDLAGRDRIAIGQRPQTVEGLEV